MVSIIDPNSSNLWVKKNIFVDGYVAQLFSRPPKIGVKLKTKQGELISKFVNSFDFDNKFFDNSDMETTDLTANLKLFDMHILTESFAKILLLQGNLEESLDVYRKILQRNPSRKISLGDILPELVVNSKN